MLKKLGIAAAVVAGLIVIFLVAVAMQPAEFRIERSETIAAPPAAAYGLVNDFHEWEKWSPWAKLDPEMETTYSGPDSGEGATYAWVGNDEVGEGRMEILESRANELVRIELEFIKPFAATNTAEFTFAGEGGQTTVTWAMYGENNFIGKAFGLLMDMDSMVGKDFESGLAAMKAAAEADSQG